MEFIKNTLEVLILVLLLEAHIELSTGLPLPWSKSEAHQGRCTCSWPFLLIFSSILVLFFPASTLFAFLCSPLTSPSLCFPLTDFLVSDWIFLTLAIFCYLLHHLLQSLNFFVFYFVSKSSSSQSLLAEMGSPQGPTHIHRSMAPTHFSTSDDGTLLRYR